MLYYYFRDFLIDYHDYIVEAILLCFVFFSVDLVFRLPRAFMHPHFVRKSDSDEKRKLEDDV